MAKTTLLPNGRLDFEKMVRSYAKEMDMSFSQAMKWFSERTSLQAACELLGFEFSYGTSDPADMNVLNQLGQFLERHGYTVPKLVELRSTEYQSEERGYMSKFRMTKEEYLAERRSGKSRTDIYTEHGISRGCLLQRLTKWGIRLIEDEEYAISKLDKPAPVDAELTIRAHAELADTVEAPEPVTEPSECAQPVDNTVDNSVDNTTCSVQESGNETQYITIRVPVMYVDWPHEFRESQRVSVDRDTLIKFGVACLANASAWAYKELIDLIGEGDLQTPLQAFMARKCGEFVMTVEVEI